MHATKTSLYIFISTLALTIIWQPSYGQICVDDYFYTDFSTATVQKPVATITTGQNEILMAGNAKRYNSLLEGGWLTKFSAQGTVLWSKQYYTGMFNFTNFTGIVPAGNDSYIISANVGDVDTASNINPLPHLSEYGLVLKVDKYGNVIWSKRLTNLIRPFASSDVTSIESLPGSDFILALTYYTTSSYRAVMRMDVNGNVKWSTLINSNSLKANYGDAKLKFTSKGNVILSMYANVLDNDYSYQRQGYYFASINAATGERMWSRFFLSKDTLDFYKNFFGELVSISELPNQNLSFITSYAETPLTNYFRKSNQVLNFITDTFGLLKKVISYSAQGSSLSASAVSDYGNGNRAILMDNGDAPYMMSIDANGTILWRKSYAAIGRGQVTKPILNNGYGFYFFSYTNDGGSKNPKFIKTDMAGNAPCIESNFDITAYDTTSYYFMQNLNLNYTGTGNTKWDDMSLNVYSYSITGTNVCRISCCSDVTDTADDVNLCNISAYTLPNNDIVKTSGTYTVTYKTSKGCDSIVYYHINLNYTPKVSLGNDTCFGTKDSVVIKTQSGYPEYTWNDMNTTSPRYVVREPGEYTLTVKNECGIKRDTIKIFKECEFEIYVPNAFTPNGDGLNDVFRIPKDNYNLLVNFIVYNRWGQIIFTTKNIDQGWNGMYKEYPAPEGTYIYYILMKSLDGRRTFGQKGNVTLIR